MDGDAGSTTRRQALVAAALGLLGVAGGAGNPPAGTVSAAPARTIRFSGGGVTGGGVARTTDGEAQFSLLATRLMPEGGEPIFIGQVRWSDPGWAGRGVMLESVRITSYGPVPGVASARQLRGEMRVEGGGTYPFELQTNDNGAPGAGADTITLTVGSDVADFSYSAVATIVAGDIALINFNFEVPS